MKSPAPLHALLCCCLFAGMLLLPSCSEDPSTSQPNASTLSGIARDEEGHIVPNALVEAVSTGDQVIASDSTDDNGMFSLANIPSDISSVRLLVHHPDFKSYDAPLSSISPSGPSAGALLQLMHRDSACAHLKLTITDNATHAPIAGADVRLRRNEQLVTTVASDANGIVEFNYLVAGSYWIRVSKPGYGVYERSVVMQFCDSMRLDIRLQASATSEDSCCHGQLLIIPRDSATNTVLIGANVRITTPGQDARTQYAEQNGAQFRELCPGVYGVRVAKDGYRVVEFSITLGCNDTKQETATMVSNGSRDSCCNGMLRIIPRGAINGALQTLVGAQVRLTRTGMDTRVGTATSSGVLFTDLCPGTYGVRISYSDFTPVEFSVVEGCNQQQEIEKNMERPGGQDSCCNGTIEIVVRDYAQSTVLKNVTVKLWKNGTLVATATTNDNGVATFTGRCMGQYGVDLIREGYTSREFSFSIGCNQHYEKMLKMLASGTVDSCRTAILKLRVKDSTVVEGGWLSGASVTVKRLVAGALVTVASGSTNAEGWYICDGLLAPSTYSVTISMQGFETRTFLFTFKECNTIQEIIRLPK